MFQNPDELLKFIRDNKVEMLDLKVIDLIGRWRHMTYSARHVTEKLFSQGTGISLSPYPGYRSIESGDMKVIPDPTTAFMDPFSEADTLNVICDICTTDGKQYARDPRRIARRAEACIEATGLKARSLWLPEYEFYLFTDVKYGSDVNKAFYKIDSSWASWNSEADERPNLGIKLKPLGNGQVDAPRDRLANLRSEMVMRLEEAGYPIKYHHHELGGPGQVEIEPYFNTMLRAADGIMVAKYIIMNTAREFGYAATFMPKPLPDAPGNGLHFHQYLEKDGKSLFFDPQGYACLSKAALNYLGGLLKHTPAIMAFTNPGTNSYRRFGVGMAAPMSLFFSDSNRSSALRIPGYSKNETEQRIEYRLPDASSNPYLAMAAQLMAGLEGIRRDIDPTKEGFGPFDFNNYTLSEAERARIPKTPTTLMGTLDALNDDREFLKYGDTFPDEVIDTWIKIKIENEIAPLALRTHPFEYELYFDL